MKGWLRVSVGIFLLLAALAPSASTMPQVESKSKEESKETLIPWDAYHGIGSPQTIEEVADMLDQAFYEGIRFQGIPIPMSTDEREVDYPLDFLISKWTTEFCILNDWPLPECGPLIAKRLRKLIVNRT